MQHKYEVPVIPQNLRQEETIVKIAESLRYLTHVSEDIFKRIDKRLQDNSRQVVDLKQRIAVASGKLDKLAGAKKATQVYSSSKYPGSKTNSQYKSIFAECNGILPVERFDYECKLSAMRGEPLEKLQFYHVEVKENSPKEPTRGLGREPQGTETVNELLLFNSGINPYKDFIHASNKANSAVKISVTKESPSRSKLDIGAAPLSISDKGYLHRNNAEMYFYSPNMGSVPSLNVPIDLPDLPGIADNVRYNIDDHGPGIAPSVCSPNLPDLPDIEDDKVKEPVIETANIPKKTEEPIERVNVPEATISVLPEIKFETKENASTIPTPPPPPPPIPSIPAESPKNLPSQKSTPEDGSARTNLMEAIRQAGGAKHLKRTEANKEEVKPKGGDLMADLHAKLSMRRKGISGTKENPTAMEKVSAMIPPPPPAHADICESTEDDDWDD